LLARGGRYAALYRTQFDHTVDSVAATSDGAGCGEAGCCVA
jgi:hypothetical protein